MATFNFNVKITTGKNTPVEVTVNSTAWDRHQVMQFKDSSLSPNLEDMAEWLQELLNKEIKRNAKLRQ